MITKIESKKRKIGIFLTVIGISLTIIGIVVTLFVPEVRYFFGIEKKPTMYEQTIENSKEQSEYESTPENLNETEKEYIEIPLARIAVQVEDITNYVLYYYDAENLCKNSMVGGYTDWRLPTKDELTKIFFRKDIIDNLSTKDYYFSDMRNYQFDMKTGTIKIDESYHASYRCRCVRTLKK
jgi:hypothetical protein